MNANAILSSLLSHFVRGVLLAVFLCIGITATACQNLEDLDGDGFTVADGDCDDEVASIHPGAAEVPGDGVDQSCNGPGDDDTDGDGFSKDGTVGGEQDCDDGDPDIHPHAKEWPDGIDQDCSGVPDDGTDIVDDDGDGFSETDGDCDDDAAEIHPGALEVPSDGTDQACNGDDDEDVDADGQTVKQGDCNDEDPGVFVGAQEQPDGFDNDCDSVVDEGTDVYDDDGDGLSEEEGDCNDANPAIFPGASEAGLGALTSGDGLDNDCDGIVDEGTDSYDDDGDGYSEDGFVGGASDCNDYNQGIFPGAAESYDDVIDSDCDGVIELTGLQDPELPFYDVVQSVGAASGLDIDFPACEVHATLATQAPFAPTQNYFVTYYDVQQTNGTGGTPNVAALAGTLTARLNQYFGPMGMNFVQSAIVPLMNDAFINIADEAGAFALVSSVAVDGSLHIFLVNDLFGGGAPGCPPTSAAGIAYFPDDPHHATILQRDCDNVVEGTTIVHEMGHIFGLWHTHRGPIEDPNRVVAEVSDGSNCQNAGDRLCDTPADPGVAQCCPMGACANTCVAMCNPPGDAAGAFAPDVGNVMSYYPDNCNGPTFTLEQQQRILCAARNSPALATTFFPTTCAVTCCDKTPLSINVGSASTLDACVGAATMACVDGGHGEVELAAYDQTWSTDPSNFQSCYARCRDDFLVQLVDYACDTGCVANAMLACDADDPAHLGTIRVSYGGIRVWCETPGCWVKCHQSMWFHYAGVTDDDCATEGEVVCALAGNGGLESATYCYDFSTPQAP